MEIRGPDNSNRPDLDRASDSRKAGRLKHLPSSESPHGSGSEGDSLEVSTSRRIEESVNEVLDLLERRADEIGGRREELLGLEHDPVAVRRAARGILASESFPADD